MNPSAGWMRQDRFHRDHRSTAVRCYDACDGLVPATLDGWIPLTLGSIQHCKVQSAIASKLIADPVLPITTLCKFCIASSDLRWHRARADLPDVRCILRLHRHQRQR